MSVCVSLGACFDLKLSRIESLRFLQGYANLIDGIELLFATSQELLGFELDTSSKRFLQSLCFVSIHMPFKEIGYINNAEIDRLLQKALFLSKQINAQYLLFHPHQIKDFELIGNLPVQVCIENMDTKNPGVTTPEQIKELLKNHKQFGFVFDVCHALDCGIEPKQFLQLKNKIKAMHVSALWQKQGKTKRHGFLVEADKAQLEKIKQVMDLPVPKIIESDIYPEKIGFVKKEIELIKKLEK